MKSLIIVDSSKRNQEIYPNNSDWVYKCQSNYIKPKKFKLVAGIIPNTQYIINGNNNILSLTYSSTNYNASIAIGNYTSSTLSTALQTALNNANVPSTTFTITNNSTTSTYTLNSTNAVSYNFSNNPSLAKILGFSNVNTSSSTSLTSTNSYRVNTTTLYKIHIKEIQSQYDTNMDLNFNFIVLNNVNSNEYLYIYPDVNNVANEIDITYDINITNLHIKVYDENNNLIQLNNDYVLIFEVYQ